MNSSDKTPNRLSKETSPYLLQHQHNPVDWYPWGEEAFERARKENKPLLISIGYSACHWCHVMEHESFSNPEIARYINETVIPVKVDREERPDVDAIYMNACTAMTGHGGWPLNAFVTPDLKPFFVGTYFPPNDNYGRPGFLTVLNRIREAWLTDSTGLRLQATTLHQQLEQYTTIHSSQVLGNNLLQEIVTDSHSMYDKRNGGFGTAPKFPPDTRLAALIAAHHMSDYSTALTMVEETLQSMANRGLYDQIGGGFYRYSVDAQWSIPHFEKMLYNQALLIPVYADAWRITNNAFYLSVARETANWVLTNLTADNGLFQCAYDADSEGVEGKFYVWTPEQVESVLPPEDARLICEYYGITSSGNFEHGTTNPYVAHSSESFAQTHNLNLEEWNARLAELRKKLDEARSQRVWPGLDTKCLTGWNGLMISALCNLAQATGDHVYSAAATRAAQQLRSHWKDNILYRLKPSDSSEIRGTLEDYAFYCDSLIDLYETTFDATWIELASTLADAMVKLFLEPEKHVFYYTDGTDSSLISRTQDTHDGALPASSSIAIRSLFRLSHLTGDKRLYEIASKACESDGAKANSHPLAYASLVMANLYSNREIPVIVITAPDLSAASALVTTAHQSYIPARVIIVKTPASDCKLIPFAQDKPISSNAQAYVCSNFTCAAPVTSSDELQALLK